MINSYRTIDGNMEPDVNAIEKRSLEALQECSNRSPTPASQMDDGWSGQMLPCWQM